MLVSRHDLKHFFQKLACDFGFAGTPVYTCVYISVYISAYTYERANLMGLCVSHHILTEGLLLFPWFPAVCGARLCEMKKENENETQHCYAFYIYNTYIMHV